MTAQKMNSTKQWHRALIDSGFDEDGQPMAFPIPGVKDRRWFMNRFFFIWPFVLGGIQLHMLAYMLVWIAVPGVLLVGYGLQYLAQKLLRWAPSDMKHMHRTPFLAGIFAGSLFWVSVQYLFSVLPNTWSSHILLNAAFATCLILTTFFYSMAMTADPGFVPKASSRGQTKNSIDELVEANAFDETHFCSTCMIRKPLRSKHCRRCGRCVAREDHHCPWVDNCVGVNNHKHFVLYLFFLISGLLLLIPLTLAYIGSLPEPKELHCSILKDDLCREYSKDPLTIVTNIWGLLQLSWTFMLVFVHLTQIARAMTTYESMRGHTDTGAITNLMTTGSLTLDGANMTVSGAGPDPAIGAHAGHKHAQGKKEGCLGQWKKLLGLDTFFAIAFNGYKGNKDIKRRARKNPFTRGVVRNCIDFWSDGPLFGRKDMSGSASLGGKRVDYTSMYEVPKGGMKYRGGYEEVSTGDEAV